MVMEKTEADPGARPRGITRRKLLAYAAATPTLGVVVRLADAVVGPGGATPAGAQVAGIVDFTDTLTLAALPTQHLLVLEVVEANRVVAHLPRSDVGQGITTAVAQIVAEESGAHLADVDVVLDDARPELLFNQLTGGSNTVHALYDPLRVAAAGVRARLVTAAAQRWGVCRRTGSSPSDRAVTAPDGPKYGCGVGVCRACTSHLDGAAFQPCTTMVAECAGRVVTTIEGLADGQDLHRVQQAWIDEDVAQCGFCQPGQIMAVAALLAENPHPDDPDIDALENACRCGTYVRIRRAVHRAAAAGRPAGPAGSIAACGDVVEGGVFGRERKPAGDGRGCHPPVGFVIFGSESVPVVHAPGPEIVPSRRPMRRAARRGRRTRCGRCWWLPDCRSPTISTGGVEPGPFGAPAAYEKSGGAGHRQFGSWHVGDRS